MSVQRLYNVTDHPLLFASLLRKAANRAGGGLGRLLLLLFLVAFSPAGAQTFTQRIQQRSGAASGKVTIHQDAVIDELVNGKPVAATAAKKTATQPADKKQQKGAAKEAKDAKEAKENKPVTLRSATEQQGDTAAVSSAPQRTRTMTGYRIQVFVGGKTRSDRQKAEQTGSALRTLFPGQKVYVHFYSPRWICRMGNFPTLAEAREMLDEVVRMGYDTATIVRGRISVPY